MPFITALAFSADCSGVITTPGFRLPSVAPPPQPEKLKVDINDKAITLRMLNLRTGTLLILSNSVIGADFFELHASFEVVGECKIKLPSSRVNT